ncbi:FAD-dependent oxidoreductase [Salipiger sp. P9]|uniref:FAD-dependent oxidoreductase n=1 Tax=Salipiger pentaromativorans TaxID=2943193 RepID=UPI0021576421|nr:FAD-dependent oxidoreductase [Salipiger pentaromativorans]MCR8547481.1 FAD-dependent oxidoreductase [Salipiger pentaromativorans]
MPRLDRRRFTGTLLAAVAATGAAALIPALGRQRALVIGGGPAGATAALALRQARPDTEVVLIERDPGRLGPAAPGDGFAKPGAGIGLAELRAAGVEVLLDEVTGIAWAGLRAALFSGRSLAFDRLLLAPGTAPVAEPIAGLDARARHLWPAAWGSTREARRLRAQLGALPETGRVVLRLPAELPGHPDIALSRALALSGWLGKHRPQARLTVLDGGSDPALARRFAMLTAARGDRIATDWRIAPQGGTVLRLDAGRGLIETSQGPLRADVVNFVPPQQAGRIAQIAGLADASGWCPCTETGRSVRQPAALILGDARRGALRTVAGAVHSARSARL